MATVYIKPGTGSGSGTLAAPYFFSELGTAETAAGNDGKILFTDGRILNEAAANNPTITSKLLKV